jgi:hypothetical protein
MTPPIANCFIWITLIIIHFSPGRALFANDTETFELQRDWWEWNFCTNAFGNRSFVPPNDFVPDDTMFLAAYKVQLKSDNVTCNDPITRIGTIRPGMQTVFFHLINVPIYDFSDNYLYGKCGVNTSAEAEASRFAFAAQRNLVLQNPNVTNFLYANIDSTKLTPFFIYDNNTNFLQGCSDNRTYEEYVKLIGLPFSEGDKCDDDLYQKFNGLDVYPLFGWYASDTRIWKAGDSHTFDFGVTGTTCRRAIYILTAEGKTTDQKCVGLFGFGLGFCPFQWLLRLLDFLTFWN